jgi:hypothetical protein
MIRTAPEDLFQRSARAPLEDRHVLRPYQAGDEGAILEAFRRSFALDPRTTPPCTEVEWQWAYRENPNGMRVWLALDQERVIAHYASRPVRTRIDGREVTFAQIVDSMLLPDRRTSLKSPGVFVHLAHAMLQHTCGPGGDQLVYGWPTRTAWRLGQRTLGYRHVRQEVALTLDPWPGGTQLPAGIGPLEQIDARIERLYERCVPYLPASTVRDRAYLSWRVLRRPGRPYRMLAATTAGGGIGGWLVYRLSDWPVARSLLLCDWLVPDPDRDTGAALLEGLLARARAELARTVIALVPGWSPWHGRFRRRGFTEHETDYHLVTGRYNAPEFSADWVRDHWWYQPLDTDLV